MTTPWYATWFNTPYYHDLYSHRDYHEARGLIQTLCKALGVNQGERALDMACGRGRHAKVLQELGLKTIGIDLSAESIAHAQEMANEDLEFKVGNMLEKIDIAPVHWTFNLFTSFGYFENDEDHQLALNNMAATLLPGGKLVMDYMNAAMIVDQLVPRDTVTTEMATYHITRSVENGYILKNIELSEDGCRLFQFQERVRAFSKTTLQTMLEAAGLLVRSVHGDYDLGEYDEEYSERMIFIATKPEQ